MLECDLARLYGVETCTGTFFKLAGVVVATKVMKGLFSKD